jgi:acyl carrier protein
MKINRENLIQVIQTIFEIPADISAESKFSDLGMDSMDHASMILEIEERFQVKVPDEHYEELNSISDVLNYLNNRV